MKTFKKLIIAFVILTAITPIGLLHARSKEATLLLWYPGAEGSPEQAAPLLETWATYLHNKGLAVTLKPVYLNDAISSGLSKIKKLKPTVAIVSLEAYLSLVDKNPLTLLAQTRNLPAGDGSTHYDILQNKQLKQPKTLYISEPLTAQFTRNILLRNAPNYRQLPLQYVEEALQTLKKAGTGQLDGAVLVSGYEASVLKRLRTPWTQALKQAGQSPRLPSPPVVLFRDWQKDFPHEKFVQLLLEMNKDPEGQELLEELRIKGFMTPHNQDYESMRDSLVAAP